MALLMLLLSHLMYLVILRYVLLHEFSLNEDWCLRRGLLVKH